MHHIFENEISLSDRLCVLSDKEPHKIKNSSELDPKIMALFKIACTTITTHINDVLLKEGANRALTKLDLIFKIDDQNKLWLLFCTRIKVKDTKHSTENTQNFSKIQNSRNIS